MDFWEYTVCMFFAISGVSLTRQALTDVFRAGPMGVISQDFFLILTGPATIAFFGLPIYGFYIMPWWKPVAGFLLAMLLVRLITRRLIAGSGHLYTWAIVFSIATLAVFFGLVLL